MTTNFKSEEKTMKNRTSFWILCLLVAVVLLVPSAAQAQCTNASLSGGWGFLLQYDPRLILILGPRVIAIPFAAFNESGLFVFDGAGHYTVTDDRNFSFLYNLFYNYNFHGEQSNGD